MIIKIENLTKFYGSYKALNNLSLEIKEGELFGFLGPNGSGKSTMIKILTGQIKPTKGKVSVMDIDPVKNPVKVREMCGIIPEQETPPSFLTAEEYLSFICDIRKIKKNEIDWWFNFLDFNLERNKLCKDLSRGTRQKLMFAQAFLHKPKIAFIDEPLINLDPVIQKKIKDFLKKEIKKKNTVFLSTHVLEIAQEICSSVGIIKQGNLEYVGKTKKNLENFFLTKVK